MRRSRGRRILVVHGRDEGWSQRGGIEAITLKDMGREGGFVSLPDGPRVVAARGAVMVAVEEDEPGRVTSVRYLVPGPGG